MPIFEQSIQHYLYFTEQAIVYTQSVDPFYGTMTGADTYLKTKLPQQTNVWFRSEMAQRVQALQSATQIIESLNLFGEPLSSTQTLHFPTCEDGMPNQILKACYEIALKLISGYDPDVEAENLSVTSQGYVGSRTNYDRSFVQDHIRAGVPSAFAWTILRPYLCDPLAIRLSRGS